MHRQGIDTHHSTVAASASEQQALKLKHTQMQIMHNKMHLYSTQLSYIHIHHSQTEPPPFPVRITAAYNAMAMADTADSTVGVVIPAAQLQLLRVRARLD